MEELIDWGFAFHTSLLIRVVVVKLIDRIFSQPYTYCIYRLQVNVYAYIYKPRFPTRPKFISSHYLLHLSMDTTTYFALVYIFEVLHDLLTSFSNLLQRQILREIYVNPENMSLFMGVIYFVSTQFFCYRMISSPASIISRNNLPFMVLLTLFWIPPLMNYV